MFFCNSTQNLNPMKKILLALMVFNLFTYAQNSVDIEIDSVNTLEHAQKFIKTYDNASVIVFNKEKHNTSLSKELFDSVLFGKKTYENNVEKTTYKIIDRYQVPFYRVSYIFLDGTKLNEKDIDLKRKSIIAQFNAGIPFADLANQYSMDHNAKRGGDLGWVTHGDLAKEFEDLVLKNNALNEIFTIDIPERGWHYVILPTHDSKLIEEIKVLKHSQSLK